MPIKLDRELPVLDILRKENVFIMDNKRANHQDIRPIRFFDCQFNADKGNYRVAIIAFIG